MEFIFLGDAIWLDFVNTARAPTPAPPERLPDAEAYRQWTRALRLRSDGARVPFAHVLAFRERLTALAEAASAGRHPPASSIEVINRILAEVPGHHRLTRVGGAWRTVFTETDPPTALGAIARSAAATLSDPRLVIRRCAAPACSLFFADGSHNHSRRLCSQLTCGKSVRVERRRAPRT